MAQVIAVANMKGGVGKTTLSAMLAETLAHQNERVLLIDLDAQGSLSFALMGDERFEKIVDSGKTTSKYFEERVDGGRRALSEFITPAASLLSSCASLDLIAAEPGLQTVERHVIRELTRFALGNMMNQSPERMVSTWIKKELETLKKTYSRIIFDCPPGISIFAFAGLQNSEAVIVPATPDYLSMLAIKSMHSRTLPEAMKGRPKNRRAKVTLLLNKCRSNARSPTVYRKRIIDFVNDRHWDAKLADIQIPLQEKLARATEADEDRQWHTYDTKYDTFYAAELAKLAND